MSQKINQIIALYRFSVSSLLVSMFLKRKRHRFCDVLWQGQKGSILGLPTSVGASASQRSPQETRTPRHAPRTSSSWLCCLLTKKKDTAFAMSFWQGQKGSNFSPIVLLGIFSVFIGFSADLRVKYKLNNTT